MFIVYTLFRAVKVTLFTIKYRRHCIFFDRNVSFCIKNILIHKCPILILQNDRRPPTPKKFSHRFFTEKMVFESIMVTSRFFDVSRFVFQKSPAQTAKWTFIWTLDTLPYLPQSPHHKYVRVSIYETIYRNVQVYHILQFYPPKPGFEPPKQGL